jgi:polyisoprenyl-phosphate glycosyltransferase
LSKKLISIAIPVYNNSESLEILYTQIKAIFENELTNFSFEICFTNDGSSDNSLEILKSIHESDARVKIINLSGNFGQNSSTIAAQRLAKGDAVITVSADLQDPIKLIPKMVKEWENGNEIVICNRESRNDSLLSKFTSQFYYRLLRFHTSKHMPIGGFDYYLTSRKVTDYFNGLKDNMKIRSMQYDLYSLGFRPKLIPYERKVREHGKSQFGGMKRFAGFVDALISVSYLPIRIMSAFGFLFSFSGFVYAIKIAYIWGILEQAYESRAPVMILLLLIGGMIMIMLGIIGEYIWRIFMESKKRPSYFIDKTYE